MTGDIHIETFPASDGVKIVGDVGGPETAPTVVLLHGGGQTRHSWSRAMHALLDAGYRVINLDARGHGESGWSPDGRYSSSIHAGDVLAALGSTTRPAALVGASMGGITAARTVGLGYGAKAVVMVDIVPKPEAEGVQRIRDFMGGYPNGFASIEDAFAAVQAYNPGRPKASDSSGLRRNLRAGDDGRLRWHWDPKILARDFAEERTDLEESVAGLAAAVQTPVLLIKGRDSDVVSEDGVSHLRAVMPRLEVLDVAGAGHVVAGDRNDAFNAGVIAYLSKHLPIV